MMRREQLRRSCSVLSYSTGVRAARVIPRLPAAQTVHSLGQSGHHGGG